MNNKIKSAIIIGLVAIGIFIVPMAASQQENEYRAFVYSEKISDFYPVEGQTATMVASVTYVPIYPSATYTLTLGEIVTVVDLSQPTSIDTQITSAVKADGIRQGFAVTRVYIPSYNVKIP